MIKLTLILTLDDPHDANRPQEAYTEKLASLYVCMYPASIQFTRDSFHEKHTGKNTSLKISMEILLP